MADRIDENTPETEQGTAGEIPQDPTPKTPAAENPTPEAPAAEVPAPGPAHEEDEEADGGAEALAAAERTGGRSAEAALDFSAPPPVPVSAPVDEVPRFAAPFSSPEPTTVTARPRRRATRPALSADPDSVAPAPAQVPPAVPSIPAFVSFVAPPEPDAVAPRRRGRRPQAESPVETGEPAATRPAEPAAAETEAPAPRRSRGRRREPVEHAADEETSPVAEEAVVSRPGTHAPSSDDSDLDERDAEDGDDRDGEESGSSGSRRRRRGRRGRGRGRSGEDGADAEDEGDTSADDASTEDDVEDTSDGDSDSDADSTGEDDDDSDDGEAAGGSSTRRRRRRRRRGESSGTGTGTEEAVEDTDDRPERAGRNGRTSSDDDVRGVAGSTRLEAKRQRRREGRDGGRKRAPILSESEFLARREAVDRAMVIRQQGERTQIAVLEDDVLVEHYVTQAQSASFAGNVYLGRVQNVLPSMEAAFVDVGKGRNAVLYAGEVNWDAAGLSGKSRSIEQALKSGDKVLVQVTKDPIGHKGARLTQQINLPGRFLVYVPGGSMTGISRKLPDKERTRLKDVLKKIVPEDAGVIIRTAAEGASEEELTRDVARLQAQWEVIQTKASSTSTAPTLLYGEPDLAIRVIRDVFNEDFKRLVVQGDDAWDTVEAYVAHVSPELSERVQRYTGTGDAFHDLRIDEQLMKALDRKVWLPSGGSLVIDRTEAMTVVDVNTGKFVGSGGNLEQTVTRNNIEAAEEIVRQLRLRDIGGMIVIDFIDMVLESNRDLVLRRLTECLGRDRTKHQVAEVTSLGLVQMTRKRVGQGLLEVFSEPCEHCRGRGVLVQLDPVDEKRRSGANGGGSNGGGSNGGGSNGGGSNGGGSNGGGGGNGSGRNRDRDRSGRDPSRDSGSDQPRRDTTEPLDDLEAVVDDAVEAAGAAALESTGAGVAETSAEGTSRSGRRSRGRRGRGQSGEARAAEDAAVLAGARDTEETDGGEPEDERADESVGHSTDEVSTDEVSTDEVATAELGSVEIAPVEVTAVDLVPISGPIVPAETEAEAQMEVAAEEPVARPRRRRAASRPAGPPS
ncbi:ribonuclease E [Modestobacter sp. DSM 44400]|uniref:Rne/Rng family ribonuclease n=1 Tax=Modestobacter sp. DSM 44400 TaxID=1550230 RepID=UPI00089766FB|nr:Rne/Rng family ribonuclease [Modestobacter sp. DSM 44400]SDY07592.1 ribonuclease E [Modestobacter sp. DSM 44400]